MNTLLSPGNAERNRQGPMLGGTKLERHWQLYPEMISAIAEGNEPGLHCFQKMTWLSSLWPQQRQWRSPHSLLIDLLILPWYHLLLLHQNVPVPWPSSPKPCYLLGPIWSGNFYDGHEYPWVTSTPQIAFGGGKKATHAYYVKQETQSAHTLIA